MTEQTPAGADEPLHRVDDDRYELSHVAFHLARVISGLKGDGQIVAVNASWGGGKTSLVNLTKALVNSQAPSSDAAVQRYRPKRCPPNIFEEDLGRWRASSIKFVDFNAWLESDNEAIAFSLIDTIRDTLDDPGRAQQFGRRLFRHVRRNPGQYVKGAIGLFNLANLKLGGTQTEAELDVNSLAGTLQRDVESLIERIKKKGRPIVVVIDDIDRMPPGRIQSLITALWWVRELPQVSFLLLYDRRQVIDSLARTMFRSSDEAEAKESAARFLEKIVQYSFDVPQPTRDQLMSALDADLKSSKWLASVATERIPGLRGDRFVSDQRWTAIQKYVLRELVNTPRAVKRLVLAAEVSWNMRRYVPIDLRDLVALEAVRLFRPPLFTAIESMAARIERGDDVVEEWTTNMSDADIMQAVLMPAHYRNEGQIRLESAASVDARRGFGVPQLMSHYLQGVPSPGVSVLYNLDDFFHLRVSEFQTTLLQAAEEGKVRQLALVISGCIAEGRSNDRTHKELAERLRAAGDAVARVAPRNQPVVDALRDAADMVDG